MKTIFKFLYKAFSEQGTPSSKRICGGVMILALVFCTIYVTMTNSFTNEIKSLYDAEIIGACGLLGLSSITNIWKGGKK